MRSWWVFPILLCVAAEPAPMTPSERAQFAAEQMAEVAAFATEVPVEPPRKLRDVLDFEWINGRLLPKTNLAGTVRAQQPLIGDNARALIQRSPIANQPADLLYYFQIHIKRFNPQTLDVQSIDISRFGNGMVIALYISGPERNLHVQITDPRAIGPAGQVNPVRVFHQVVPRHSVDEVPSAIKFEAPTLLDMIRQQRKDAVPVLRTVFHAIGRPDIIGSALNPLWIRALTPWIVPPQPVIDRVTALVTQLDADDYDMRQSTFEQISAMGEEARLVLIKLDQTTLSPEQRSAISALLEPISDIEPEEIDQLINSPLDLVDGLYASSPIVREAVRTRIESLTRSILEVDTTSEPSIEVVEAIRSKIEKLTAS